MRFKNFKHNVLDQVWGAYLLSWAI